MRTGVGTAILAVFLATSLSASSAFAQEAREGQQYLRIVQYVVQPRTSSGS